MSKEVIIEQLQQEKPDWLLISNLAKKIYLDNSKTNTLGFKKGSINVVKCSDTNITDIVTLLRDCFNSEEYVFINVGGWGRRLEGITHMDVTKLKKALPTLNYENKYIVIVTDKPAVMLSCLKAGLTVNDYQAQFRNKYDRKKDTYFRITNSNDITINCKMDELRAHIRDLALTELLNL